MPVTDYASSAIHVSLRRDAIDTGTMQVPMEGAAWCASVTFLEERPGSS
jgi:hypothetical protein